MSWEDRPRRDVEACNVGPVEDLIIYRDCKTGHDDDDQPDGPDRKVGHMCNTLVIESDVTSSMMGEMYKQLASAQLRGKLYKTGYRRTKAAPREIQGGATGQTSVTTAGHGVGAVAMEAPGPLIPGAS